MAEIVPAGSGTTRNGSESATVASVGLIGGHWGVGDGVLCRIMSPSLEGESKEDYSRALADFQKEWQPSTATEHDLAERLAGHQWLCRLAVRLQMRYLHEDGRVRDFEQFNLYRRYETKHERAFNKALADLMRLRSIQLREKNGFESQRRKDEEHAFRIRALQHSEKMQGLAIRIAEAKLARFQPAETTTTAPQTAPGSLNLQR